MYVMRLCCRLMLLGALLLPAGLVHAKGELSKVRIVVPGARSDIMVTDWPTLRNLNTAFLVDYSRTVAAPQPRPTRSYILYYYFDGNRSSWFWLWYLPNPSGGQGYILTNFTGKGPQWYRTKPQGELALQRVLRAHRQ